MKKQYQTPALTTITINTQTLLAASVGVDNEESSTRFYGDVARGSSWDLWEEDKE